MTKKKSFKDWRRRRQKIVFAILVVSLSVGLISSSIVWMGGNNISSPNDKTATANNQETISSLEEKAKENPKDAQASINLARAYENAGRLKEALDTYEKAVELKPDDGSLRIELAYISYLLGNYDKAILHLQEELKRHPDDKEAHLYYGMVLADGKKDYERGISEVEKFIEIAKTGDEVVKAQQLIDEWKKVQLKNK